MKHRSVSPSKKNSSSCFFSQLMEDLITPIHRHLNLRLAKPWCCLFPMRLLLMQEFSCPTCWVSSLSFSKIFPYSFLIIFLIYGLQTNTQFLKLYTRPIEPSNTQNYILLTFFVLQTWIHAKVIPVQTMAHAWMKLWDSRASVLNSGEEKIAQVCHLVQMVK